MAVPLSTAQLEAVGTAAGGRPPVVLFVAFGGWRQR